MVANKDKLIGKIAENGYTKGGFAKAMGMSCPTLRNKMLSEEYEFTLSESAKAKEILHLTTEEYLEIFINFLAET